MKPGVTIMHTYPYIEHTQTRQRITCTSIAQAIKEFYRQWRDSDGAIPWVIVSDGRVITEEDLRV
jgi:hypothetical protein